MTSNPISRRICMLTLVITLVISLCVGDVYASRIISHDIESTAIANNKVGISGTRHIEVYLPDGYEDGKHRYPVIYWIPGYSGSAGGATYSNALDEAIKTGRITPTIAVFIDVHEGIWFLNSLATGNWEDFIVSELVPFIDKTYPTIPDPNARGLGGHSAGGYSAFILPILHPNIWGCIGGNDPAIWLMWYPLIDKSDVPVTSDFAPLHAGYRNLPKDIGGYNSANLYTKALIELGTSFSPNLNSPILCDMPVTPDGNWVPEIREKWSAYDLTNPNTLPKYVETLKRLLSITIVVPEIMNVNVTNSYPNIYLIDLLKTAGITITRLDMPGDHGTDMPGRFIAITEQLLIAMQGSGTSISSRDKLVATWGEIKSK
jgi:hypothetical protein